MWVVYDSQTDNGEGGDRIVALCDTLKEAKAEKARFEAMSAERTHEWHDRTRDTAKDFWEHMRAYYYTLALDVTRYYILEEDRDGGLHGKE